MNTVPLKCHPENQGINNKDCIIGSNLISIWTGVKRTKGWKNNSDLHSEL